MKPLNIYFCGSMRGVTPQFKTYQEIVIKLEEFGKVLTRHVAFPEIWQAEEKNRTDKDIWERDLELFQQSNIMVAEVTSPSHGVGIELGWAMQQPNYKVLCLSRKQCEFKTSALIAGCPKFVHAEYESDEQVIDIVAGFMKNLIQTQ